MRVDPTLSYYWALYTLVEYTLFTLFFFTSLSNKKIRLVPVIGSIIFYGIVISNFARRNTTNFDSISASVEAILMIIYSIVFLYSQITSPDIIFVYNTKKFWVVIAIFLYFSSTLFLFIVAADFAHPNESSYWIINILFEILKNTLFCIAFAMKKRNSDEDHNSFQSFNPDLL